MKPAESKDLFKRQLGQPVESATPRQAFGVMFAFYAKHRADGVAIDEDGDMLLYEWGVFNFSGPESFQFGITRQFVVTGEDEPRQLHLTLHFAPTDELRKLRGGSKWCHSPEKLTTFRDFVESSEAFRMLADSKPMHAQLYFEQC